MKVVFYKPHLTRTALKYVRAIFNNGFDIGGDGQFTQKTHAFFEKRYGVKKVLLTTSGTTALEMAVELLNLQPYHEVITPSFTFSSTANAIIKSGARVVFAEIDPNTLNIDPSDIEKRITKNTKAILVVHYAGVACDMGKIMTIARHKKLKVIEDAAQAIESKYKDKYLGTIGDFGCLSFHETKNVSSGEGGALFINTNNRKIIEKAETLREKGTNRSKFFRGEIDKYTWVSWGSSYLPSDILVAILLAQLEEIDTIQIKRLKAYNFYTKKLSVLTKAGIIRTPSIPSYATHNAHMFYILFKNVKQRDKVMFFLKKKGISAYFHYVPLHSSPYGEKLGYKRKDFPITEKISSCLLRLPLYSDISRKELNYVVENVYLALKKL